MVTEQQIRDFADAIVREFKPEKIILFGSYAGGTPDKDSDVDLLIALEGEVRPTREIGRLSALVADVCLRHDLLMAVYPVPADWVVERRSPLFENIRREGVRL